MNFDDYEVLPSTNVSVNMTAGAIAGVLEHCVMYPLDSVKVSKSSSTIFGDKKKNMKNCDTFDMWIFIK